MKYAVGLLLLAVFDAAVVNAQMPSCTGAGSGKIYYIGSPSINKSPIFILDPTQPMVQNVNPVFSMYGPTNGTAAIAISPNINLGSPSLTYYTLVNEMFYYYNGSTWLNTGHVCGSQWALNIGAGGGYIYSFDAVNGKVYKYDGTSNSTLVLTVPVTGAVADVVVDNGGNFFLLFNGSVQKLNKYSSNGTLLKSYPITGIIPTQNGGGGFSIINNKVYYDDGTYFWSGSFSGTGLAFTSAPALNPAAMDFSNCPFDLTGISNGISLNEASVSIFPNPAKDKLTISWVLHGSSEVAFSIIDVTGRVVEKREAARYAAGESREYIDVRHLTKGVYFIRLSAANYAVVRRVEII